MLITYQKMDKKIGNGNHQVIFGHVRLNSTLSDLAQLSASDVLGSAVL